MGLEFNKDTAVYRQDAGYYDKVSTSVQTGQDIYGEKVSPQTSQWNFFAGTAIGTYTETLTQDIVLTCFSYCVSTGAGAASQRSVYFTAKINGVTFSSDAGTTGVAGQIVISQVIPIPNWILPAGTELEVEIAGTGSPQGNITFTGYVA